MSHYIQCYQSPIGVLCIEADGQAVTSIHISDIVEDVPCFVTEETIRQLKEYFAGKRTKFDIPLHPKGTEFQRNVWHVLKAIPYGETRCYQDVATAVGNPRACRAVGMANNKNPIMIIVPCHRVIGKNGTLGGYAGGLDVKIKLLQLEKECQKRQKNDRTASE